MQLNELGEFRLIEKIKQIVNQPAELLLKGIDDDAAVYEAEQDTYQLVTTDAFVEDVHFKPEYFTFYQLGWRVTAANLSDIAAMGGKPEYLLFSLAIPKNYSVESVEEFYRGAKALAGLHGAVIIGGDTTASPDRLFVSVTVIGSVEKSKLALRSGAKAGDSIFVTGYPGCSAAGLHVLSQSLNQHLFSHAVKKHLLPEPRVAEAQFLVANFPISAMIDVSDGIASEVNHICYLSNVGAIIYENQIPVGDEISQIAQQTGHNPLDWILSGGEDFELLFTTAIAFEDKILRSLEEEFKLPCSKIGEIKVADAGMSFCTINNNIKALEAKGFDHFTK